MEPVLIAAPSQSPLFGGASVNIRDVLKKLMSDVGSGHPDLFAVVAIMAMHQEISEASQRAGSEDQALADVGKRIGSLGARLVRAADNAMEYGCQNLQKAVKSHADVRDSSFKSYAQGKEELTTALTECRKLLG